MTSIFKFSRKSTSSSSSDTSEKSAKLELVDSINSARNNAKQSLTNALLSAKHSIEKSGKSIKKLIPIEIHYHYHASIKKDKELKGQVASERKDGESLREFFKRKKNDKIKSLDQAQETQKRLTSISDRAYQASLTNLSKKSISLQGDQSSLVNGSQIEFEPGSVEEEKQLDQLEEKKRFAHFIIQSCVEWTSATSLDDQTQSRIQAVERIIQHYWSDSNIVDLAGLGINQFPNSIFLLPGKDKKEVNLQNNKITVLPKRLIECKIFKSINFKENDLRLSSDMRDILNRRDEYQYTLEINDSIQKEVNDENFESDFRLFTLSHFKTAAEAILQTEIKGESRPSQESKFQSLPAAAHKLLVSNSDRNEIPIKERIQQAYHDRSVTLSLRNEGLERFHNVLLHLNHLEKLDLSSNPISLLPPSVLKFKNLKSIDMTHTKIDPNNYKALETIKKLRAKGTEILVDPEIDQAINTLDIISNLLAAAPHQLEMIRGEGKPITTSAMMSEFLDQDLEIRETAARLKSGHLIINAMQRLEQNDKFKVETRLLIGRLQPNYPSFSPQLNEKIQDLAKLIITVNRTRELFDQESRAKDHVLLHLMLKLHTIVGDTASKLDLSHTLTDTISSELDKKYGVKVNLESSNLDRPRVLMDMIVEFFDKEYGVKIDLQLDGEKLKLEIIAKLLGINKQLAMNHKITVDSKLYKFINNWGKLN
ncbi:hypothetical protein [Mycoavidus sp. B2-EB]|uniref:hypothetical protein n=1 Tax=Mycoavidus sp. B2-EB TaxID=2651972 RepID=UPI001628482D|nr:hypothetical protein [Mycoavidus sp. B2-EB]BBO59508.1 hypothetical protein MPB2EB_0627 [Mycoavidus sp. B2-EB]